MELLAQLSVPDPVEPYVPDFDDYLTYDLLSAPEFSEAVDLVFPPDVDAFLQQLGLELAAAEIPTIDLTCSESLDDMTFDDDGTFNFCGV